MSTMLEAELLAHLDAQIASARRLLALVLEQGGAIRSRDVDGVLGKLAEIQTEMGRRGALEMERAGVLQRAGAALGFEQVLLGQLVKSMASDGPLSEGPYAAPVQDALSGGLINNGGLGLANDLYRALKERQA